MSDTIITSEEALSKGFKIECTVCGPNSLVRISVSAIGMGGGYSSIQAKAVCSKCRIETFLR